MDKGGGKNDGIPDAARHDAEAMEAVVGLYADYVHAIVWNILGPVMPEADAEETESDAFLRLWDNADKIRPGKLKPYLGAIARNLAKNRRRLRAVVIAAAAALLLGGATAVASSDRMAQRLEEYWSSLTGSKMPAEQQELVNSMTSSVGQSQTHNGVTVTVDSVIRSSRQVWVLLDVVFPEPRPDVTCVSFSQPMPDDSLGTVLSGSGDSSRVSDSKWQIVCEFDLADDASTGPDTDFTLRLGRLLVCTEDSDESSESDDAWTFSFALPAVADVQSADPDEPVQFEDAEITDISVTESG